MGSGINGDSQYQPPDLDKKFIINEAGLELVKHFESLFLNSYIDPIGVPTIGYGKIRFRDGSKVELGQTCTKEQAEKWLIEDLEDEGAKYVRYYLNDKQEYELNQNQFSSLVSFTFNRGAGRFRDYIAPFINKNDISGAMTALCSLNWAVENGQKIYFLGLHRRRWAERYLFEGKDWRAFDTVAKFKAFKDNNYELLGK